MLSTQQQTQATFFRFLFKERKGIICIARIDRETRQFHEEFFDYDGSHEDYAEGIRPILSYLDRWSLEQDLYIAPFFLDSKRRTKETIEAAPAAYADLDECHPDKLKLEPSIVLETSPGRYQALWIFDELVSPVDVEDLSRRIAYFHAEDGADKSGWDLTQLLRIPHTTNFKHRTPTGYERVTIFNGNPQPLKFEDLQALYPQVAGHQYTEIPMPTEEQLAEDPEDILQRHRFRLTPTVARLYELQPTQDWSRHLWQLENLLFEAGLTREEAYIVCVNAACNKYKRDNRDTTLLWKEICKCYAARDAEYLIFRDDEKFKSILTNDEIRSAEAYKTIVDDYVEWARSLGDAAWQYHQITAFVLLSSLMAGYVRLPTSFGTMKPNVWAMIMADTTLTRKTTAMDLGMELLTEIDPDAVLATDGSLEGLFQGLSLRAGRPSIFLKDEFSGLLEAMVKKDYMSGMAETLTKLYDGKYQKRLLRKEIIEVRDPVLIFFAGGTKTRIQTLLNAEHVTSGFLPRFLFVSAESDVSKLQPLGPPTERSEAGRELMRGRLATIAGHYATPLNVSVNGKLATQAAEHKAILTPEAWGRYGQFESDLLKLGLAAKEKDLATPMFDRMAKSGLKLATLLGAAKSLTDQIVVTEEDLVKAFYFIEQWRPYAIELLEGIGKTTGERLLARILSYVDKNPGINRSRVMIQFQLTARDADMYFATLEQRGVLVRMKHGRGEKLYTENGHGR